MRLRGIPIGRAALVVAIGAVSLLATTSPAHASCVGPARPSPHAFAGTVIGTDEGGRVATVITDRGDRVTVLGTPDRSWFTDSYTSVDRRYALGGRYVFHPINSDPPYQDNACTATHQVAGPPLTAPELSDSAGFLPHWLPVDEQAGPIGYLLFFGPLAAGVLALAAVARALRRRRRSTHDRRTSGPISSFSADTPNK